MVPENHKNPSKPVSLKDIILVYWRDDKTFYPGVITELTQDGNVVVHYDDGDFETLSLSDEVWKFAEDSQTPRDSSSQGGPSTTTRAATEDFARPAQQLSGPGTSSNRHSENTVITGSAVEIEIAGSRKPATSSSNVEHPVQQTQLVLSKTVKGTPSTLKPIDATPIPRKRVEKNSAVTTDVPTSPKRVASSSNVVSRVLKQPVPLETIVYHTPSSLTQSDAIPIPRNPRNIVRTAGAAATDVSVSRKRAASSERAVAKDVPTSRKRSASCSNFGNPVPKKKALLSTAIKHNSSGSTQAETIITPTIQSRFAAKPPLQPKSRVAPISTSAQPRLASSSTSNALNHLSNKKALPTTSGKHNPSISRSVDTTTTHPSETVFATKQPLQLKPLETATITTAQLKPLRPLTSNVVNPVLEENSNLTATAKDNLPSSTAADAITNPPTETGYATKPPPQSNSRVVPIRTTAQQKITRPLTPCVPIPEIEPEPSTRLRPIQKLVGKLSQDLELSLDPLTASVKAQLNTLVPRISSLHDMLRNTDSRANVFDESCKRLRADVESLESEVNSRTEMNNLLNDAFEKQIEELKRLQTELLEQLKKDFKSFVQDEMNAIEKDLIENIREKSLRVFKEKFREVAESTKDASVKSAIEDMSLRTVPCRSTDNRYGAGPSRSE